MRDSILRFHLNAADAGVHEAHEHRRTSQQTSMFKKLGGRSAIEGVVDEFYSRVFVDDEVKGFFEGIDKQGLKSHQVKLLPLYLLWGIDCSSTLCFCECFPSCLDRLPLYGIKGTAACNYLQSSCKLEFQ